MFGLSGIPRDLFWLAVIMLGLAYYVAVSKETPAFAQAFVQVFYAVTGRNSTGNFANYPK